MFSASSFGTTICLAISSPSFGVFLNSRILSPVSPLLPIFGITTLYSSSNYPIYLNEPFPALKYHPLSSPLKAG